MYYQENVDVTSNRLMYEPKIYIRRFLTQITGFLNKKTIFLSITVFYPT